jgi:AcrR family transcriptional regulator
MDLRMVKTRRQIKAAFLALREKKMPEKIKVKDICDIAMINKTTFYNHYTDSAELSNEIDEQAIECVVEDFKEKDKIFDDPKAYIMGLISALEREAANLRLVFRGKQEVLYSKLGEKLSSFYEDKMHNIEDGVKVSFFVGGFMRVARDIIFSDKKYDKEQLSNMLSGMLETVFSKRSAVGNA